MIAFVYPAAGMLQDSGEGRREQQILEDFELPAFDERFGDHVADIA